MENTPIARPRVLVTGAAGFFSHRLAERLESRYDLVRTDLTGEEGGAIAPLDLLDYKAVEQAMEGMNLVIHLAIASNRDMLDFSDASYTDNIMRVNMIGTQHVLQAASVRGVSRVLLFGSQMASVGWPRRERVGTDLSPRPMDIYGLSKLFCETLGELYARQWQLPVAVLRVGEPWPRHEGHDMARLQRRSGRHVLVHFDDIYKGIECALTARNVLYSVTDCISFTDTYCAEDHRPNLIGYRPGRNFTKAGAEELEGDWTPSSLSARPRIAAIVTAFHQGSHADVILRRWFESFPADAEWGWNGPRTELAGAFIDQPKHRDDIGVAFFRDNKIPRYESVREALTLGTGELAVDGVILIGEHGDYPYNDIGQQLYPRKELFDAIVEVFRESGRAIPVFNDKHLSWNMDWAQEMCETALELGFLLFAGSSIPLCPLEPEIHIPPDTGIEEAVVLFFGPDESYGFHSLEFFQAIYERTLQRYQNISGVTAWRGDEVWKQMEAGTWSEELFDAALAAVDPESGQVCDGDYRVNCGSNEKSPAAFQLMYQEDLLVTHVNMTGHLKTWAVAMRLENGEIVAAYPRVLGADLFHPHFAALSELIDTTFCTGRAPHALQRSMCTTGAVAAFMRALEKPGVTLPAPDLCHPYNFGPCARWRPRKRKT